MDHEDEDYKLVKDLNSSYDQFIRRFYESKQTLENILKQLEDSFVYHQIPLPKFSVVPQTLDGNYHYQGYLTWFERESNAFGYRRELFELSVNIYLFTNDETPKYDCYIGETQFENIEVNDFAKEIKKEFFS
jgi:hypothetical protein